MKSSRLAARLRLCPETSNSELCWAWGLVAGLILTGVLYWPGLSGPFLYDDMPNLVPVLGWFGLQADWQEAVFGNQSGPFGRPLSMLTFMASASCNLFSSFDFKLDNLLIHLVCGTLLWQVLRRVLSRDPSFAVHANGAALSISALWLLHPVHVSTVLYVIQRMAQLGALFVMGALWAYLAGREQLLRGDHRRAWLCLFLLVPTLFASGILSKENAIVAPAMCLVLELAYFDRAQRPGRTVPLFFLIFLVLPLAAGLGFMALKPGILLGGYQVRDFDIFERSLTQARALTDYIGLLIAPRPSQMGLYTDDFVVSTGLWSPPGTFWSLLGLVAASAAAIAVRRRIPSVFAGWFLFLAAHAMESTIFPLDMYYEHRNYLPAVGLLLACAGGINLLTRRLIPTTAPWPAAAMTLVAIAWLALGTHERAITWQDKSRIVMLGISQHPGSLRAHMDKASLELNRKDYDAAYNSLEPMRNAADPRQRMLARVTSVAIKCASGEGATTLQLAEALAHAPAVVNVHEPQSLRYLSKVIITDGCGELTARDAGDAIVARLKRTRRDARQTAFYLDLQLISAKLYGHAGAWAQALSLADAAWSHRKTIETADLLARAYARLGQVDAAKSTHSAALAHLWRHDRRGRKVLEDLHDFLEKQ